MPFANPSQFSNYAKHVNGKFDDIVILGIGGSALGTACLRDAFSNPYRSLTPRIHVLDNVDPHSIELLIKSITWKKTLFIVVSKSGKTPETLAQYFYFKEQLTKKKLPLKNHFVFITDSGTNFLQKEAKAHNAPVFEVPINVGGRFSVLSAVGLVPAALMGLNLNALLKGAQDMTRLFLDENTEKNIPFQFATIQYLLSKRDIRMTVMMPYSSRLKTFGAWYAQLLAESIGKTKITHGKKEYIGLTPISAVGTTDQHSQVQLFNEGPTDKLITFIEVKNHGSTIALPAKIEEKEFTYLQKISFTQLLNAEKKATADAMETYGKPHVSFVIDKVDEYHLGALFMLFEGATAFLGEFFGIDAFDQPGVELGKILTKKYLTHK
ncbi:MAG: glucose-6-phosphate isomerase [Bacteroidota bacterium]